MNETTTSMPVMYRVEQRLAGAPLTDVAGALRDGFDRLKLSDKVQAGQKVAVAVGSRGICQLQTLVTAVVERLEEVGAEVFIIPAMGSHGGATAEGQIQVLNDLGITSASVGVPIKSNMEAVSLGRLADGVEVFFAKDALEADHVVVINRVKPHTAFRGEVESGLCKMLSVGCGKQKGAAELHKFGLERWLAAAAEKILEEARVLCGVAVVENGQEQIHTLKVAGAEEFVQTDRELLREARELLPRLPVEKLDILVVDEMGKNISGAGLDPNVTGFWRRDGGLRTPDYQTIIVLDLTPQSHGNATGIGMVDLTTRRVIDQIDMEASATNAITAGIFRAVRLPLALENDKAALETALNPIGDLNQVRMVRIVNTQQLQHFWVTEALVEELKSKDGIEIDERPLVLEFNAGGRLRGFV